MKKFVCMLCVLALLLSVIGCAPKNTDAESNPTVSDATDQNEPANSTDETEETNIEPASYEWPQVGENENVKMAEQEPERPLKFAYLGYANNPFYDLVNEGIAEAREFLALHNVTLDTIDLGAVESAEILNNGIDAAIVQGYDGILCMPYSTGSENYIDKAVENGLQVVTLYGESSVPTNRLVFIGQDNYDAGERVGEEIYSVIGDVEGAKFATITAYFASENLEIKRTTASEYLTSRGYTDVGGYEANDSAEETYNVTRNLLTAHPDLKAIYCVGGGPYGAVEAIEEMGLSGQILVIGHDETAENLEYVKNGQMTVIGQNPAGVAFDGCMYLYNKIVAGQDPEQDVVAAFSAIIRPDNVEQFIADYLS